MFPHLTNHIVDALAEELIAAGIMTEAEHIEEGIWKRNIDTTRVFNNDETPQFIHYGVDGTSSGLVYAAKGDQSKKCRNKTENVLPSIPSCHSQVCFYFSI